MRQIPILSHIEIDQSKLVSWFDRVAKRVAALMQAWRHRFEVNQLAQLDDRALRDIGLTRGDVFAALEQPMDCDPSLKLSEWRDGGRSARMALRREANAAWRAPSVR